MFTLESIPITASDTAILIPDGSLDGGNLSLLESHVMNLAGRSRARIVIDLSKIRGFSTSAAGLLLGLSRRLRSRGGELSLLDEDSPASRQLEEMGLRDCFTWINDIDLVIGQGQSSDGSPAHE